MPATDIHQSNHPRPEVTSRWRHADGGVYKVTGFRLVKDDATGIWQVFVEYDHDDGNTNPLGLAYATSLHRWHKRFVPEDKPVIPEPPWPIGTAANAKRVGWTRFFMGHARDDNPFPQARKDLEQRHNEGWDAAKAWKEAHS